MHNGFDLTKQEMGFKKKVRLSKSKLSQLTVIK
jgi:hypothetical protein